MGLDGDKGRATSLVRADHPAGELGGERGLALAALTAHHGVALVAQQPLEREELAAAANEGRRRLRGQRTETVSERGPQVRLRLRRGGGPEELRVVLFLEEHGHEPIVELQFPRAEDAAPGFVVIELALAFEHGIAHARTAGERGVEGLDEAARGLDEDAVAHGHHGGHADLQQLRGDGFGRLLGRGRLAGFEEDERDAVLAEQRAEFVGEHGEVAAVVELAGVLRILEAKAAEPGTAVKDAVAIEVDDVIGLGFAARAVEFLAQRRQRRRTQHMDVHEAAECLHRFDKRQRTGAMIDVTAGFVLRARGDEQDADGRVDHGHLEIVAGVRQAPPDARGLGSLKQETRPIVKQFPREAKQDRGGFARRFDLRCGRTGFGCRIDMDGESAADLAIDPVPRLHDVPGVLGGQGGGVQKLSPLHEVLLDLARRSRK